MIRAIRELFESWLRYVGGPLGRKMRIWYYRKKFKTCGDNCVIEEGVHISNPELISLGNSVWIDKNTILIAGAFDENSRKFATKGEKKIKWGELVINDGCHIAPFSLIQAHGGVSIGNNVTIASGAKIYSLSHHYRNLNDSSDQKRYSFSSTAPIEDQFLVVGNVLIGDNAAVGINSVILPGTIVPNGTWIGVLSSPSKNEELKENTVFKN
jgi:acetyltransferase-like isoleucine patch superfamily enzyme